MRLMRLQNGRQVNMWKVDILSRARYRQNVPHVLFLGNLRKFDILNINLLVALKNFLKGLREEIQPKLISVKLMQV